MIASPYRFFRFRQRYVDWLLLAAIPPATFIFVPAVGPIAILFLCVGLWLLAFNHASVRYSDKWVWYPCLAFFGYALLRTGIDFFTANFDVIRCTPSELFLIGVAPLSIGIVLVKRPLQVLIVTSRILVTIATMIAIYHLIFNPLQRIGYGTNPLIAGYIIGVLSCLSRLDVSKWEGKRPNFSFAYFYMGIIPVFASGNRILMLFYLVALFVDGVLLLRHQKLKVKLAIILAFAVLIAVLVTLAINSPVLRLNTLQFGSDLPSMRGINLRFIVWEFAFGNISASPIFGMGHCSAVAELIDFSTSEEAFPRRLVHYHNMYLDMFTMYGLLGFILFIAAFMGVVIAINRRQVELAERFSLNLIPLLFLIYGLTGSAMSDERMMVMTVLPMAVLVHDARKRAIQHRFKMEGASG